MRSRNGCLIWSMVCGAMLWQCGGARAQEAAVNTGAASKSFLRIIYEGAEEPGAFILLMSIAAVTLVVEHFMNIRAATMAPDAEITRARSLVEGKRYKDCLDTLRSSRTMFASLVVAGLGQGKHGFDAMVDAMDDAAIQWSSRLNRRVEYLNVLGNLGPLMGLLGTVIGMIKAFSAMQSTHGAYKTEDLAGGISLALVNTFLGLALAIVALGFFGVCRNRVDRWTGDARTAAMSILEYFRPGPAAAPRAVKPAEPATQP